MLERAYYLSPFGCIEIQGSHLGIKSVKFKEVSPCASASVPDNLKRAVLQLDEYFKQERRSFDLPLDWSGASSFYKAVWKELLKIPFGHTTSYSAIAKKLKKPKSVRAVGQANARNPIAIIVPCHRVIAKSGDLQGYFYGLDMKRKLLGLENPLNYSEQGTLF